MIFEPDPVVLHLAMGSCPAASPCAWGRVAKFLSSVGLGRVLSHEDEKDCAAWTPFTYFEVLRVGSRYAQLPDDNPAITR
jgi:hypothetical protein